MKSDDWRMNDDGRRTVRRQKGERKSDDRRTNNDDERTVRRQNGGDRRTVRRQKGERKSDDRRTNGGDRTTVRRQNDDDKRTETMQRGVIRKFASHSKRTFKIIREEMERKLEDTKQQVQREILEKIEGLGHQLHRTSIADSGDYSTSPDNLRLLQKRTDGLPKKWLLKLVISLRGQALEILQSIPEEQQNDYDRIIGALEIRYGHKYLRQVYQSQIKSRQQRSNESLQEYEADIERLIHLAYPQAPKEFLEQIGIQTFIDGLLDSEMQQALRLGRHTTISDALIAALEFKAAKEASRSYKHLVRQVKFDECQRQGAATTVVELGTYSVFAEPGQGTGQDHIRQIDNRYIGQDPGARMKGTGEKKARHRRVHSTEMVASLPQSENLVPDHHDAERDPGRACVGDAQSAPLCGQHDERVGDIMKQEQVYLRGRHGQSKEGVLPVLNFSNDTSNELLMATTVQVEDEWYSEEMMKSQKKDNDLRLIRNWVKNGVRPTWQEVSRYGTTIKGYWAQWNSLCLRDGLLHRKWESPDGVSAVYQLVLPKARIHQVLEELHNSPTGGHFGVTRTLARVRDRFYWVNCRRDVEECCLLTSCLAVHWKKPKSDLCQNLWRTCEREWTGSTDLPGEKLKIHSDKMKQRLDTTSTETAFKPGDAVWLYAPKRTKGKSPKLQSNWEGPYTIIKKINDLVYRIQLSPRSKPKVVHLERLAKYTGHNPPDWFVVEDPPPRTEDSVIRDE
ncbi:hypothetical protein NQ318_001088 [Aromia moschata]|uniref:Polyprotein n=1 Tax=Aromia moschata TaxID=1265417 RepID=A0AAV8ZH53_9CUCU|nr:hypothetical protein NQ318_001088 [Aromia moschata]